MNDTKSFNSDCILKNSSHQHFCELLRGFFRQMQGKHKNRCPIVSLFSESSFQLLKTQNKGFRSEAEGLREGEGLRISALTPFLPL